MELKDGAAILVVKESGKAALVAIEGLTDRFWLPLCYVSKNLKVDSSLICFLLRSEKLIGVVPQKETEKAILDVESGLWIPKKFLIKHKDLLCVSAQKFKWLKEMDENKNEKKE